MNLSEQHMVIPSLTETHIELLRSTHERTKLVHMEHGAHEQLPTQLEQRNDEAPKAVAEKSVKMEKICVGPEIRVLQLDVQTTPDTTITGATQPRPDSFQTSIQSEKVPENKDEASSAVEVTVIKVQESSTECQEDVSQKESSQPQFAVSQLLQPRGSETELIEISLYEQGTVKVKHTETKMELSTITQGKAAEVTKQGAQEKQDVLTYGEPKSRDEKSDGLEGILVEREVRFIQLDIPTGLAEQESTFVMTAKEQRMGTVPTQSERQPEKNETTADIHPDRAAEIQQITGERQESVAPSDSSQLSSGASAAMKLEVLKTAQERPKEIKDGGAQEGRADVSAKDVHDTPRSLEDKSVDKSDTQAGMKEREVTTVKITKESITDIDQTSAVYENKNLTSTTVQPQTTAVVMTTAEVKVDPHQAEKVHKEADVRALQQNIPTGQVDGNVSVLTVKEPKAAGVQKSPETKEEMAGVHHETAAAKTEVKMQQISTEGQQPAAQTVSADSTAKTEFVEIIFTEEEGVKPRQTDSQLDLTITRERLTDPDMAQVLTHGMDDKTKDPTSVTYKIHTIVHEYKTVTTEKEAGVQFETVKERKDTTDTDKSVVKMTGIVQVQQSSPESLCGLGLVQTEKKEEEEEKRPAEEHQRETAVRVEIPDVATAGGVRPLGFGLPQVAQKLSSEVIQAEGLPAQENKEDKGVLEGPVGFAMRNIFTEIQLLPGTEPSSRLWEGKSVEDASEALKTFTSDQDVCLSRLVSKVLSLKNRPAELNLTAMAQQVEEAQQCRETIQAQKFSLSQLRGADGEDRDTSEHMEDQWSTATQDVAALIQNKEAQLQLVTDFCTQVQKATTTLERETAGLDSVKMLREQSSSEEAEKLCSLQRRMEEKRTVLGELLVTYTKLWPHLSQSERATAQTQQKNLHEKWRGLERAVERSVHLAKIHSQQLTNLQAEIVGLQEHLGKIDKDLKVTSPSVTGWSCKKAQQLMEANAELKATRQKCLYLQKLLEELLLSALWQKEAKEIQQGLQTVKDKLSSTGELVSTQTQDSSNPIMEKIIMVMRDGLAWAKQTESDIEGRRKRVALLPEEVHRQIRDLKKLQSEVMVKQGQLQSLVEEVTELLPQLDQTEEVPMLHTALDSLQKLSKSTSDQLAKAVREIESGLQTREKLSEQMADLDSWVVAHLHREACRNADSELRSPNELNRRARQIQETLAEADKQAAVCEALLMKSKDISSELSVAENCQLFEKLTNLQEDIRAIISCEKANKKGMDELIQTVDSNKKNLITVEKSLMQMMVDLNKHRFPITRESLQVLEPFKHTILAQKSQVDLLQPWIPQEKARELYLVTSELYSKMVSLEMKARGHERYLNMRQRVEDLREDIQEQIRRTKEDNEEPEEKYKVCQTLLVQIPLIKCLCDEACSKLEVISADLYPSQLTVERHRLKQNEESLDTLEIRLYNNLSIIEWGLLKELDLDSEMEASHAFLLQTQQELQRLAVLEPKETDVNKEHRRIVSLKRTVESRMRALEVLQQNKGTKKGGRAQRLMLLKDAVLHECDAKMESILKAREALRSYTCDVNQAVQFLGDVEASLVPPQGSAGLCSEQLEETQKALVALQEQFQSHVERLQNQFNLHPHLSPQKVQQLLEDVLSQLLVKMSTLQAKGHLQLERLSRCAEQHKNYSKHYDEISQSVKSAESSLSQLISEKVTCLADCTEQEAKLRALSEEVESLLRRLEELKEWCPEQSCHGRREVAVAAVWKRVWRLRRCTQEMAARSKQRITECSDITSCVEKASSVLEQVETELPTGSGLEASTEEFHDLIQSWEQYQDRLDCEHRSLSALELRAARLLGVPAHLEEAPPTPLCQQLQAMQARYSSVKQSSRDGLEAARMELEEREKNRDELQSISVWMEAADGLLSEMEQSSSSQDLQEVHSQLYTQKALLQRIMESLKMKYTLVPVEIEGQLHEVKQSLQQVEVKVGEAVERSGPVHRLGAKLSEIHAGLSSVQKKLEQRSPTVIEAKITQKRVWDDLDVWHSALAALEVAMQDLENPEEALTLTERLVEVQQLHSRLGKQAEQRTTLLSKIHTWLQEHQEMISSSKSWMSEAQTWLAAPCTYTTAKCLRSHVNSLQTVLNDSAQIRSTLQGFGSVLQEMSQVCDVTTLQQQLIDADRQVADVQNSFAAPLSQLEHAAAEVEAIETEVWQMETDVAEIKTLLMSPETFPSPREEGLKVIEQKIQTMRRTVAEIQKCKPDLCLPEKAEETLTVFTVVDSLQALLLDLEKVPAVFIQQPPTPVQVKTTSPPELTESPSQEAETEEKEQGQITIVHVEEDVLKRSGAALLTVEQISTTDTAQEPEEAEPATGQDPEQTEPETQDVEGPTDTTEASSSEALSRAQVLPESMELMQGQRGVAWRGEGSTHTPDGDSVIKSPNTLTKQACTPGEESRAVRSGSSEVDGGVPSVETSHGLRAERAEASTPLPQDRAEGLHPAAAPGPEEPGPGPSEGGLHVCLQKVSQLELWLQKAQRSLRAPAAAESSAMQYSVEQQLLTCQEMFLEIEQKVASLSPPGPVSDLQQQQNDDGGDEPGAVGSQQEVAELLSSKLQLLKANLVSFQLLLQDRQEEESSELQEQRSLSQAECHLEVTSRRSSSVQEIFSSPRNKLLRQSSLQQQKELEQELSEQRGLTQAIARQGSRGRLQSQDSEDGGPLSPQWPPAEADVEEKKWNRLHSRLLALEESWLLPPSKVTDSSWRHGDGTAGCMIGTQNLKELQTLISRLGGLKDAAERLNRASSVDGSHQTLDEGLFQVLHGASLSLSSINNLLRSPAGTTQEGDAELRMLQSLSAELDALNSELASRGSKVAGVLGSECVQRCADDLSRVLPVVLAALSGREKQLRKLQEETAERQKSLKELHAAFSSNQSAARHMIHQLNGTLGLDDQLQAVIQVQETLQQQAEQVESLLEGAEQHRLPASLIHHATQLQGELDVSLRGVGVHRQELRSSLELQQQYERLLHSLEELLALGSQRLTRQPDVELRQQLSSHTKFFQFLDQHFRTLQFLTCRLPESALQRWDGVVKGLQEEAARLQQLGLEKGTSMQETLEIWSRWEEDVAWSESLLKEIETSFSKIQEGNDSEQRSICQELRGLVEANEGRVSRMLEAELRLKRSGQVGVGVANTELDVRWRAVHRKLQDQHTCCDRKQKLRSRFLQDSVVLADWLRKARDLISHWSQLTVAANEESDVEQRRDCFLQCVTLTKELESRSELKVMVMGVGSKLIQMREPRRPSDGSLDLDLDSIQSQLRQIEVDWSSLLTGVPVVQRALHKRWMKMVTQQEALLELQVWLGAAESQLEEHLTGTRTSRTSFTKADVTQLLKYCKECQTEMSAHQDTLDFVNQALQTCDVEDAQKGRYDQNQFSEDQGRLNHQWLRLQETLNAQIQEAEQDLRDRAELEVRLQQVNSWITDQRLWMDSAQRPNSQKELQRSMETFQDLEEKIQMRSVALQELRDKCCGGGGDDRRHFISQTDKSIQACVALTQQRESVSRKLLRAQQVWDDVQRSLDQRNLMTVRLRQALEHHGRPQLSLQAHRELHQRLQLLQKEAKASSLQWDELSRTVFSLGDIMSPAAAVLLTEQLAGQRDRWTDVCAALDQQLQRSQQILQVWEVYSRQAASFSQRLQMLQSDATSGLSGASADDSTTEKVAVKIHRVQSLLERADMLQADLGGVLEASKDLTGHLEPSAASLVQSESRLLSRGVLQLSQTLTGQLGQQQEELERLQEFGTILDSLEGNLEVWQQRLENVDQTSDQSDLLELSGLSADLDVLNELSCSLTLGDAAAHRLQRLNHRWVDTAAKAEEACSELQAEALRQQSFEQKCGSWMSFLQRMEDSLAVDVAGSYDGLRQQLRINKRFQAELSTGHQILHSVIAEALHLLQRGEVDDRSDFILKLAQLREHWQGAVQRADQRRSLLEGLVQHWHLYSRTLKKLQKFLSDANVLLPPSGPVRCSLQQLRRSLQDLQHTELLFQRYQCSFIHTLEVGRQLFSMGDEETQTQLQTDLGALQEEWDDLHSLLGRRMDLTEAIVKNWERCEAGLAASMLQLKDVKTRLNQSMPDCDDELQSAKNFNKETEDSLEDWAASLKELSTMKTDLSQYIIADDVLLLQEQVEHLHCQWEELCLKVSLRKQEIADRLNAWIIFNEKNKELCEWLTQMENKVAHNSDLNIEEMVEKLKKDCMEEINLFSENKTHLKQLGEQLITASNKTKETEINDKLKDINDRWQHLFDHIEARVRKLKETLVTVQQLDKNMSNLRTWLSRIEAELARPVVYNVCHSDEIQRKLAEQQDLQRDIEQHTESVASVLTLCDVLLHDADACGSDSENDSIQQTTRSLDRRWRNICAMSMERRMRIEETWRLWCKFLDDYSRFEGWLKAAELTAARPDSADVLYTSAKEELKKFEAFQRQVHEWLTQLELVNKQYRRLARENRTDTASRLKVMVHEGNRRWDALQRRVAAVLRRLKHFTSQREDFEGTREGILVWLTEMDLQLTNVEHFSESDIEDKMRQLNGFQQEITLNTNKIDALIVFGENLIQKSAPLDAVLIEDELEELHSYCQEVFGRVARFHHRLVNRRPVLEEERDLSDRDTDLDDSPDLTNGTSWHETRKKEEEVPAVGGVLAGRQAVCHLLAPPLERSGRETPVSVDSIPLEWDHTVDVGGSSSHEDDEDATFFSALSVKSDPPSWHQPNSPERKRVPREMIGGLSSSPSHGSSSTPYRQGYEKLMSECSGSIDNVKRVKLILNDDEDVEEAGLTGSTANRQTSTGVIERWELLQAPKFNNQTDVKQSLEQWQKLNSDLCDVTSWLGRVLPELERLQRIAPSTSIRDIEVNIRKLKEMQKTFNSYKCLMISVNLSSRHFLQGDSAELRELQEALSSANVSWTQACSGLEGWERRLHGALMTCQEFHETLHALLLWLAQAENKLFAVNVSDLPTSGPVLLERHDVLTELQQELLGRQQQVSSLQDISSQLLLDSAEDSVEAKEKVHVIGNKLRILLRKAAADLQELKGSLAGGQETGSTSSEMDDVGGRTPSSRLLLHNEDSDLQAASVRRTIRREQRPFFYRVLRAAFPLHLLFLVLLVLVCLVPLSEEDFSCTLSNNFARSFYPMLRYTNGPPPT